MHQPFDCLMPLLYHFLHARDIHTKVFQTSTGLKKPNDGVHISKDDSGDVFSTLF
jgi:hypothetical protein